ncbi:MAG: thrombospondin type 3 repeat-containing protein, partial [Myxococcales bacterium]|nr:thrombospondin type 3 repeat-containing protein [Myxococcales bacterium]
MVSALRSHSLLFALILGLSLTNAACSDTASGKSGAASDAGGAAADVGVVGDGAGAKDVLSVDAQSGGDAATPDGTGSGDTGAGGGGTEDGGGTIPDDFDKPCQTNADCLSGYCMPAGDGKKVCSTGCSKTCPSGFSCQGVKKEGQTAFVCVPVQHNDCAPCEDLSQCGATDEVCGVVGAPGGAPATYCLRTCKANGDCPSGSACEDVAGKAGADLGKACVPKTGSCVCTATLDGTQQDCSETNSFGTCKGERSCAGAKGWSVCSAAKPAAETCDGQDNDCDGSTDEGIAAEACTVTNSFGTCTGSQSCKGSKGLVCDAPTPATETCDGSDNDCDGDTDEGYPDIDWDGQKDCVDKDDDDDGVADSVDDCPKHPDPKQLDFDKDGKGDACDSDDDGDGIADGLDNCKLAKNADQKDTDGDGEGDACDLDDDGDLDPDTKDCAPLDKAVGHLAKELCDGKDNDCDGKTDELFGDTDGDGKMDCVDTDDDGDGSPDKDDCEPQNKLTHPGAKEVCDGLDNDCNGKTDEGFADLDKNGVADCLKKDADGDGSPDGIDCKPTNKAVYPGAKELCDGLDNNCSGTTDEGFADTDGDKLMDCIDPDDDGDGDPDPDKDGKGDCSPKNASISHKAIEACNGVDDNCDGKTDEGYPDSDGDKVADCADKDDDGDGILDGKDNCPITKNPKQVDTDGDGVGDACDDDADNDGVSDSKDNCKGTKNSSQLDMDKDGIGDACDGDDDGDGSPDKADCAPLNTAVFPGAKELCNGIDDSCDGKTDSGFTDTDGDKLPDCIDPDDDNDGALDGKDCAPTDATVSPLVQEVCDGKDNDCDKHLAGPKNPNAGVDEGFKDTDGDKQADCIDSDDDGDGKPDAADNCPLVVNKDQKDTDKDGLGDVCDPSPAGKISKVLIRTAPGGGGIVVGALKAKLGETFTMYAAAYTDKGLFGGDIAVSWGATGTLTGITAGPSVKLTWSPKKAGQAGTITAAPKDKAVTQAATGLIEVVFPPPGEVHAGHSTVSTSRSWAETDGKQTVEITVLLKDVYEQAVVKPQTVQIQTTLGTLTGAVKSLGGGRYSQVLTVGTKPGYAKITVTAGGKKLSAEPVVQFVEVDQLPDKFKLDCSNYAKFKGHSLQIKKTTVTIDSVGCAPMVFAHIFVTDGGVLTHTAYNATTKKHQAIDLDVASLWVDSGAKIDVTARGYSKYVSAPDVKGAGGYGGGSHGGRGGLGTVSGAAFDDMTDPHLPGGGGGSNWGGVGGGVVRVHVRTGGKLVVHGAILANGNNSYYGGGAGGAISLSAPQVGGVGEIKALGGYGWKSKYASSGGGGGGRIAVTGFTTASGTFDISNWAGKMSAAGGTSYHSDRYGGAGTVWVQAVSGDRGSLVVDNIGRVAFVGSTPLLTAGVGTNELWTNGKLGDNEATWAPGTLRGSWVNVNPAKGTDSLADDAIVRVLDNDKTSLSLEGGKTALSSKGAKFSGIVVVDHLDVLGGASLGGSLPAGGADVLVWKGNRALKAPAGSGPTFSVKGGLVLPRLEVILAQTLRVEGAAGKRIALNLGQLDANGGPGKPLHLHLSHSTLALPKVNALDVNAVDTDIATSTLTAKALDMKDGKLDAETLQVFGDATLSGKNLTTIGKDLMEVGGALELRDTAAIWPKAPVAPKTGEKPEIRRLKLSASWLTVQKSAAIRADARGFTKGVIPTGTAAPTASWSYTG